MTSRLVLLSLALALSAGTAHAQIKIGVAGPMTGALAVYGQQMRNGAEMAVADIDAKGGVLGKQLELTAGDDQADPKQGVSVANKMAGDGVKFVAGHLNSGVSIAASDVYAENGILEISPSTTNPSFTDRGLPNVFRTCGRDDQQGKVAGAFLAKTFAGKKIAVLDDKTTYGRGLADETKKALVAAGMTPVLSESINGGEKDYGALVSKIKAAQADVVYFGGTHADAGLIIRQMRDQGVKAPLMGGDGINSGELAAIAGPDGIDGTLMTFSPDPRKIPGSADVVARFRAKSIEPEAFTLYTYAAVEVWAQAVQEAGSTDTTKVAKVIHSGRPFQTVVGQLSYDAKGDITTPAYVVYRWKKGADGKADYSEAE
ncbi:MAG: branched-chain amino acid ABC transporter substrate-binding protein [Phyllobacteriaceae bacterium]|nr:branched-chain amino acid ABC transporter substrate-binding protein [Phyllobacteriaceae bacterium]